jgi:NADH:ubiquinone oxidoreductase subunit 3 (subunit A)
MFYLHEFLFILFFLILSLSISIIVFFLNFFLISKDIYIEKNSAYECGFNPFGEARNKFDIRFYLVGILFIIFDLEVIFLFPWCLIINEIGNIGFFIMIIFLLFLLLGFLYEWKKNALEWS